METHSTRGTSFDILALRSIKIASLERGKALPLAALSAIVILAAVLRFANLAALGYANHYYAAAVASMLQSWHNFFYVAAEPGGSVSVDKPPLGLWFQAISAHFLGVNGFGLLLPEIVAGLLSVVVVYHLVRRSFGAVAGLLAALALAITPVVVATDRNNTMDSILILVLLLAAWVFMVATERGKLRFLLLGAVLVGIGFNIKMMEAYLTLPAFFGLYFLGSPERLWRKTANLALAAVVVAVVSLSWTTAVDLTPADQRPYVGSSKDNSEMSLVIGHNGVVRLVGMGGQGGLLSGLFGGSNRGGGFPGGPPPRGQGPAANGPLRQPGPGGNGPFPVQGPGGNGPFPGQTPGANGAFAQPQGGNPGGFGGTGRAGALRLFTAPLSK